MDARLQRNKSPDEVISKGHASCRQENTVGEKARIIERFSGLPNSWGSGQTEARAGLGLILRVSCALWAHIPLEATQIIHPLYVQPISRKGKGKYIGTKCAASRAPWAQHSTDHPATGVLDIGL